MSETFSEDEIQHMLDNLDSFNDEEVVEIHKLVDAIADKADIKAAYDD